jgi:hypothetical protein
MSGKTGTTESHRSSGFVGFTNRYAAANYIFADSSSPSGICSFPLRPCGSGDLYGGNEPARTWFEAMKPIATDFGDVSLPPTDPRYVDGAPGGRVPSVSGLDVDAARQRLKDAGFQVADQPTSVNSSSSYGTVVGTTPSGQTFPGSIITITISNGIAPAPPPAPVERPPDVPGPPEGGTTVVEIPGLPPITVPLLGRHRRPNRHRPRRCQSGSESWATTEKRACGCSWRCPFSRRWQSRPPACGWRIAPCRNR